MYCRHSFCLCLHSAHIPQLRVFIPRLIEVSSLPSLCCLQLHVQEPASRPGHGGRWMVSREASLNLKAEDISQVQIHPCAVGTASPARDGSQCQGSAILWLLSLCKRLQTSECTALESTAVGEKWLWVTADKPLSLGKLCDPGAGLMGPWGRRDGPRQGWEGISTHSAALCCRLRRHRDVRVIKDIIYNKRKK